MSGWKTRLDGKSRSNVAVNFLRRQRIYVAISNSKNLPNPLINGTTITSGYKKIKPGIPNHKVFAFSVNQGG